MTAPSLPRFVGRVDGATVPRDQRWRGVRCGMAGTMRCGQCVGRARAAPVGLVWPVAGHLGPTGELHASDRRLLYGGVSVAGAAQSRALGMPTVPATPTAYDRACAGRGYNLAHPMALCGAAVAGMRLWGPRSCVAPATPLPTQGGPWGWAGVGHGREPVPTRNPRRIVGALGTPRRDCLGSTCRGSSAAGHRIAVWDGASQRRAFVLQGLVVATLNAAGHRVQTCHQHPPSQT